MVSFLVWRGDSHERRDSHLSRLLRFARNDTGNNLHALIAVFLVMFKAFAIWLKDMPNKRNSVAF